MKATGKYDNKQFQAGRLSERVGIDPSEIKVRRIISRDCVIANVGGSGWARWVINGMHAEPLCDCVRPGQTCEACAPTSNTTGA